MLYVLSLNKTHQGHHKGEEIRKLQKVLQTQLIGLKQRRIGKIHKNQVRH
jgi:hypothetical protein